VLYQKVLDFICQKLLENNFHFLPESTCRLHSASERALRNFTVGRKNWVTINTVRGAQASAIIYSITETARANDLNVYYYIRYLLSCLPSLIDKNGNVEQSMLEPLMPWSKTLPADCYSKRRK